MKRENYWSDPDSFSRTLVQRLQGMGQSLTLQECTKKQATVMDVETSCGFQPFTTHNSVNYTIGTDGW